MVLYLFNSIHMCWCSQLHCITPPSISIAQLHVNAWYASSISARAHHLAERVRKTVCLLLAKKRTCVCQGGME